MTRKEEARYPLDEVYPCSALGFCLGMNVLTHMPEGAVVFDRKGLVIFTNTAYEELTGYSQNQLLGRHFSELVRVLGAQGVYDPGYFRADYWDEQAAVEMTTDISTPVGRNRGVSVHVFPIRGPRQEVELMVALWRPSAAVRPQPLFMA